MNRKLAAILAGVFSVLLCCGVIGFSLAAFFDSLPPIVKFVIVWTFT